MTQQHIPAAKIKLKDMAYFQLPKCGLSPDHIYHPSHHNSTTFYQHLNPKNAENPNKTPAPPQQFKSV
jgi:hypothetical protein